MAPLLALVLTSSGMAMGVFGEPVNVSVSDGAGGAADLAIPALELP